MKSTIFPPIMLMSFTLIGCNESTSTLDNQAINHSTEIKQLVRSSLIGEYTSPLNFANPYPNVPAQCYTETSNGRQNACLFCHSNGLYNAGVGNNNPQAGAIEIVNFQIDYGFDPLSTTAPYASINRWENTLYPQKLAAQVTKLGIDTAQWNMQDYIRSDNWQAAYDQRLGSPKDWDSGYDHAMRLFPGLNPSDLPADDDGFVRTKHAQNTLFNDNFGGITGWRAINFMPYGIFTPINGSVSGIYIRLPKKFIQTAQGEFDLSIYVQNLTLLEQAISNQPALLKNTHYLGAAADEEIILGVYPKGTEFAHPLHYVDTDADGISEVSDFPGTRSQHVKEIRYMYKYENHDPMMATPGEGKGDSIYGRDDQGWVNNGAGWILAGYIEDSAGQLRPQNREELTQCIGCHSGYKSTEFPNFSSGTGNTVDSTWAFPRKLPGASGWQEMNYLGYQKDQRAEFAGVISTHSEPLNRSADQGEFGLFLQYVVGASLYGDMPEQFENNFEALITIGKGYEQNWPALDTTSAEGFDLTSKARQSLLRAFVKKGDYLSADGQIKAFLLYPTKDNALEAARRYRQVVATQRYQFGKDVFSKTPVTYKHYRLPGQEALKIDGSAYQLGEVISERSVQLVEPTRFDYRAGDSITLIEKELDFADGGTFYPEYIPYLKQE
ncbi:MAG: hypothetical protein WBM99_06835 [Psychromonas sp.]